jgi:hypothetical protein
MLLVTVINFYKQSTIKTKLNFFVDILNKHIYCFNMLKFSVAFYLYYLG